MTPGKEVVEHPSLFTAASEEGYVIVVLRGYKGITGKYKVNLHCCLQHLAERIVTENAPLESILFFYHGKKVFHSDTPFSLGLEHKFIVTLGYRMDSQEGEDRSMITPHSSGYDGETVRVTIRDSIGSLSYVIGAYEPFKETFRQFATSRRYGGMLLAKYNGFKIKASNTAADLFIQKHTYFTIDIVHKMDVDNTSNGSEVNGVPSTPGNIPVQLFTPVIMQPTSTMNVVAGPTPSGAGMVPISLPLQPQAPFPFTSPASSPINSSVIRENTTYRTDSIQHESSSPYNGYNDSFIKEIINHKKVTNGYRFFCIILSNGNVMKTWQTGTQMKKSAPDLLKRYCVVHGLVDVLKTFKRLAF